MGHTLNMIVLFSLILVLGMLVDNAIVIVENIYRHREEGEDGIQAAMRGTDEVAVPVITSTITTLVAFAPMLTWPGIVGDFMSYLPVTLIIGLTASLLVALVFNPTFCAHFMAAPRPRSGSDGSRREGRVLAAYRKLMVYLLTPAADQGSRSWFLRNWALPLAFVVLACAGVVLALFAMLLDSQNPAVLAAVSTLLGLASVAFALQGVLWIVWTLLRRTAARKWPAYVTDRRSGTIWSMGALLAATFVAYGLLGRGVEFFPEIEPQQIFVDVEAPSGATLDTSNRIVARIEERTEGTRDKLHVVANVGSKGISVQGGDAFGGGGGASRIASSARRTRSSPWRRCERRCPISRALRSRSTSPKTARRWESP
jgi:multidrug efflux pump subunit AcrB